MVRTDIDMITVVMKYQNDWSWSVPLTLFIYQTAQVKVSEQDIVIIFLSEFRKHYLAIFKPLKFYSSIMHFKKVVFLPSHYTPGIYAEGYIVFVFPFVRSYVR